MTSIVRRLAGLAVLAVFLVYFVWSVVSSIAPTPEAEVRQTITNLQEMGSSWSEAALRVLNVAWIFITMGYGAKLLLEGKPNRRTAVLLFTIMVALFWLVIRTEDHSSSHEAYGTPPSEMLMNAVLLLAALVPALDLILPPYWQRTPPLARGSTDYVL